MGKPAFDCSVMLLADPSVATAPLPDIVDQAVLGGASMVQLRVKNAPIRDRIDLARSLSALLRPRGIAFLVNDRVDVALAAGADGVHIGQTDMAPEDARRLMGPDALIGLSLANADQAAALDPALLDYVGIGPVFPTTTKPELTAMGLDAFKALRARVDLPAVAIAGIDAANAARVVAAGADGVAVISAICAARDPRAAARGVAAAVASGRAARSRHKPERPAP